MHIDKLYNTFRLKLALTPSGYVREFHDKINWNIRRQLLKGTSKNKIAIYRFLQE